MRKENHDLKLYWFIEKELRSFLGSFYKSIVEAHENASSILKFKLTDKNRPVYGYEDVKNTMNHVFEWLERISLFTKSDKIFLKQILEPLKSAARIIFYEKEIEIPTITEKVWVFAKSSAFNERDIAGTIIPRITLSVIIPNLNSAMSIRLRKSEAEKIEYGMNEFSGIKPIPIVNRIHQRHMQSKKIDENIDLSKLIFLKTSFADLKLFYNTLSVENFCDISSSQSDKREHLGAVVLIAGKIIMIKGSLVTVCGIDHDITALYMQTSEHLIKNLQNKSIGSFEGKTVRLIAVIWYQNTFESYPVPEMPEIFYMEIVENTDDLIVDEIQGYVRIRGNVDKTELEKIYGTTNISTIPSLIVTGTDVSIENKSSLQEFVQKFLNEKISIMNSRLPCSGNSTILISQDDIIDKEKLSVSGITGLLKKHNNLRKILYTIIKQEDKHGESAVKTIENDLKFEHDFCMKEINFLRYLGLVENDREKISSSKKGRLTAYLSMKKEIDEKIETMMANKFIDLTELEEPPSSFLLNSLKEYEKKQLLSCENIRNKSCDLFWTSQKSEEISQKIQNRFDNISQKILQIMGKFIHPLGTKKILELLNNEIIINYFSIANILSALQKQDIVKEFGDTWEFPLESRIYNLLLQNPDNIFSVETILEKITVPYAHGKTDWGTEEDRIKRIKTVVATLISAGKIFCIANNMWSINSKQIPQKINDIIKKEIKATILQILPEHVIPFHEADDQIMVKTQEICHGTIHENEWLSLKTEAIDELSKEQKIHVFDGWIKRLSN